MCPLMSNFNIRFLVTPWTAAYQAPPSMGFSRQEYWSGLPLPSPIRVIIILLNIVGSVDGLLDIYLLSNPGTVHGVAKSRTQLSDFTSLHFQGLNPGFPHCRQILYHMSYQGSPY